MAINLNLTNQPFAPTSPAGDYATAPQTRGDTTERPATSTVFVNLSDQSQSPASAQNVNEYNALDVVETNPEASPPATNSAQRQINTLEQQQTTIQGEQQDLQDDSERIEQQIRVLEQQERIIDQRLNRLKQSQSLGLFVDLKA